MDIAGTAGYGTQWRAHGVRGELMELIKFRITNFRSINDSGEVTVDKLMQYRAN
jgi:hypothetical protein